MGDRGGDAAGGSGARPTRSRPAQANPWFFFAAGIWFIILVIHALRAYLGPPVGTLGRYFRRPIAKAELDREVERLKGRR